MNLLHEEAPTVIHVEDNPDWQKQIREELRGSGVLLREIVAVDTMEKAKEALEKSSGPLILIIDLRLGKELANYDGFMWLLDYLPSFAHDHASTIAFVVSGNLHESNAEALRQRGIPPDRQFKKGDWDEASGAFVAQIREFVQHVDDTALRNMAEGVSASKMDPHLLHALSSPRRGSEQRFHLLVRVRNAELWDPSPLPDLKVVTRVGGLFLVTGTARTVAALERNANVLRVEYSRPVGRSDCHQSVPFVKATAVHTSFAEQGDQCLIGIIDDGIDVLQPAFFDELGTSRIVSVWDQRDETGPAFAEMGGTVHTAEQIREYIKKGAMPGPLGKRDPMHGTHVASIAAGRAIGNFAGGVAPAAKIAVVIADFDTSPEKPASIGYSYSHIFALQYLKAEAERLGLPLVINISQGMNAGAHDGSSELEKALDDTIGNGKERGFVIVKSAGNERGRRRHALVHVMNKSYDILKWTSSEKPRAADCLDLWFSAGDRIRFRLTDPNGASSRWVGWGAFADQGTLSGVPYHITFVPRDDENGLSRCLITVESSAEGSITEGVWQLEIETKEVFSGQIHAWLERDSSDSTEFMNHFSDDITLSIPGTANYVICVGASGVGFPLRPASFSSWGPTRDGRQKPELSAPGDPITAVKGGAVNELLATSGTSQAAPHVTGAVAILMSYRAKQQHNDARLVQFNAVQVQTALTQLVQNRGNQWHPGLGYGVLDVDALIREMTGT